MNHYLSLPDRVPKKRTYGLSSIHDVRLSIGALQFLLEDFHEFVDIAKIGVGTAYIMPRLKEKIELYDSFDIKVHFGGTLFEKFYHQNKLEAYKVFMDKNKVGLVEISSGTISIPLEERLKIVEDFKQHFEVMAEVGYKETNKVMPPSLWLLEMNQLQNAGSTYIITEGRSSGTAGIYRPTGALKEGLIEDIANEFDLKKIIFEAPTSYTQMAFIQKFGANVNLGNINPNDVLLLEAQRQGLRSETFFIKK